jgi:hypothetical protein
VRITAVTFSLLRPCTAALLQYLKVYCSSRCSKGAFAVFAVFAVLAVLAAANPRHPLARHNSNDITSRAFCLFGFQFCRLYPSPPGPPPETVWKKMSSIREFTRATFAEWVRDEFSGQFAAGEKRPSRSWTSWSMRGLPKSQVKNGGEPMISRCTGKFAKALQ